MDEVDGMSAGDRGGVGALNALIKKSKVSIVVDHLVCWFDIGAHHLHRKRPQRSKAQAAAVYHIFPAVFQAASQHGTE